MILHSHFTLHPQISKCFTKMDRRITVFSEFEGSHNPAGPRDVPAVPIVGLSKARAALGTRICSGRSSAESCNFAEGRSSCETPSRERRQVFTVTPAQKMQTSICSDMWSDLEAPRGLWCDSGNVVQGRCQSPFSLFF